MRVLFLALVSLALLAVPTQAGNGLFGAGGCAGGVGVPGAAYGLGTCATPGVGLTAPMGGYGAGLFGAPVASYGAVGVPLAVPSYGVGFGVPAYGVGFNRFGLGYGGVGFNRFGFGFNRGFVGSRFGGFGVGGVGLFGGGFNRGVFFQRGPFGRTRLAIGF